MSEPAAYATNGHTSNGQPAPTLNAEQQEALFAQTYHARELALNYQRTLFDRFQRQADPRRNLNRECGYPETSELTAEFYQALYDRDAIAARVVEVFPSESWKVHPQIFEKERTDRTTQFEQDWDALNLSLMGEDNWYESEEGGPIYEALRDADIQAGIGGYGIILVGLDDGKSLSQPAKMRTNARRSRRRSTPATSNEVSAGLLYLSVFPQAHAPVSRWVLDKGNPRYGLPEYYRVTFGAASNNSAYDSSAPAETTEEIHWTRVVHIAERRLWHRPRMQQVLNHILNLQKIHGAAPEGYWQAAVPRMSFETTHPEAAVDKAGLKDMIEAVRNGFQRDFTLENMTAKPLSVIANDPNPHVQTGLEAICIKLNLPIRKLKGSERGELASSQDEADWNDTVKGRNINVVTPRELAPLVNRFISLGILTEPTGWKAYWPDITNMSATEKAQVLLTLTQAYTAYTAGGMPNMVTEKDYMTRFDTRTDDEAEAMLEASAEAAADKIDQEAAELEMRAAAGLPVPPTPPVPGEEVPGGGVEDEQDGMSAGEVA